MGRSSNSSNRIFTHVNGILRTEAADSSIVEDPSLIIYNAMRDLDELSPGFQVLAGKIGPSHAFVCVRETGIEVNIFGINVRHNDLIHADRHGAVVIPNELAEKLPKAIDLLLKREKIILDACKRKDFEFEVLKKAILDSSRI